ncbi:MAG: hypothetical protein JWM27_4465, partial [Gemmatimonadetes bacterium]|nr:hypothetical protein [Gemmatimonadota bacterium]
MTMNDDRPVAASTSRAAARWRTLATVAGVSMLVAACGRGERSADDAAAEVDRAWSAPAAVSAVTNGGAAPVF